MLTLGEIRRLTKGLPDDTPVVMHGYFSESETFDSGAEVWPNKVCGRPQDKTRLALWLPMVDVGEEPE